MKDFTILATDQSTTHVGWCIFDGKDPVSWGEFKPDPPHYDALRRWIGDQIDELSKGDKVVYVAVEDVYLASYPRKFTDQIKMVPQVEVYKKLLTVREHVHAATRDVGAEYLIVKPFDAMVALTGVSDPKTKREERKKLMMKSAELLLGEKVSEHVSDSVGIGLGAYNQIFTELHR